MWSRCDLGSPGPHNPLYPTIIKIITNNKVFRLNIKVSLCIYACINICIKTNMTPCCERIYLFDKWIIFF